MKITLRAARVNAELTQRKAAQRMGIDVTTLLRWEKGRTSPRAVDLQRLCQLYGLGVDDIFLRSTSTKSR